MPIVVKEPARPRVVSMDVYRRNGGLLYNVKLGGMCPNDCQYCYLYSANKLHPEVSVYVDTEAMKRGMKKLADGTQVTFNAGEHTDSLSPDPITRMTTDLVPFIPSLPNALLELRTKSAEADNLEHLDHQGRTVVAWSLAPQVVNPGEIISIELQPDMIMRNMRIGEEQELTQMALENSLLYYLTIGKQGVVVITAKVIKDDEGFFQKLKFDLTDIA